MVALSQSGHLEVMYLGTDPAVFVPPQVESRDVNYATLDAEMARLMKHIKSKSANNGKSIHFWRHKMVEIIAWQLLVKWC